MEVRKYGLAVHTAKPIDQAEHVVREALSAEGFGVLTEIDVAATLKQKIGVERPPYKILGACNPQLANRALQAEPDVGLLLPCNVVLRESGGGTDVSALDPNTMSTLSGNAELEAIARDARERLERALAAVEAS